MRSYIFDPSCTNPENIILRERYTIEPPQTHDYYFIVPKSAPFFAGRDFSITHYPSGNVLEPGKDYVPSNRFVAATRSTGLGVYGSITILDHTLTGVLEVTYHTIGGIWTFDANRILEYLTRVERDPRVTSWESVLDQPATFPPTLHDFDINDLKGWEVIMPELVAIREAIDAKGAGALEDHISDYDNPHRVDKLQVGLGNVMNYHISTIAEANAGVNNTSYMTPLRTKNLVERFAISPHMEHLNDHDNPHGVTKVQLGLGNVENYPPATASDIDTLESNNRYMTPMRTSEALQKFLAANITPHLLDQTNPHGVTKGQIGLGSVENLPLATVELAEQGVSKAHYMTPFLTDALVQERAIGPLMSHVRDLNNPHGVTKTHVGLGNVPNYGPATTNQALEMSSRDTIMTPYLTRLALQEFMGTSEDDVSLAGHLADRDNPHRVTAEQVGAYTKDEIATLLLDKLNSNGTAVNSDKLGDMSLMELVDYIRDNMNLDVLSLLTPAQVTELGNVILQGTAASAEDASMLEGNTLSEVIALANGAYGSAASVLTIPQIRVAATGDHHVHVGTLYENAIGDGVTLLISGGKASDGSEREQPPLAMLHIDIPDGHPMRLYPRLISLTGYEPNLDLYMSIIYDGDENEGVSIWLRMDDNTSLISVTNLTPDNFHLAKYVSPEDPSDIVPTLPTTGELENGGVGNYEHTPIEYIYSPLHTKHFTPAGDMIAANVPQLNQSTTGNAGSASKLQTLVTINGTVFDGTKNVTTANWGTGRTLTIGDSAKIVDGSNGVNWSLAEIGAVSKSDYDAAMGDIGAILDDINGEVL